jgi:hypothetical protein
MIFSAMFGLYVAFPIIYLYLVKCPKMESFNAKEGTPARPSCELKSEDDPKPKVKV